MLTHLLHFFTRSHHPVAEAYDLSFVKEVSVRTKPVRNRRVERFILLCWVLIAGKTWLVTWLVDKYHIPFNALWVVAPTVAFALLGTAVYYVRRW